MTLEDKITVLYSIAPGVNRYEDKEKFKKMVRTFPVITKELKVLNDPLINLAVLIHQLEDEQRMQGAKSSGKGNALKVAEKVLKRNKDIRNGLCYANIVDGNQYICDGRIGVCYSEGNHLPLEEMPKDIQPLDTLPKFFADMDGIDIELPDLKALKNYIKMQKSLHKGDKNYCMLFDFGVGKYQVNAQFLAEVIEMLPDAKAKMQDQKVVFEDENGNKGLLMVVRVDSTGKRTEL